MTSWIVVEDEPDLYDVLLSMYDLMGVNGIAFTNGEDAVDWISAVDNNEIRGELPELALIDIRLPGKTNGAMVGNRLRNSPELRDIVIVLITAYKMNPAEEKAIINLADADDFIYKPLPSIRELNDRLKGLIKRKRR